MKNIISLILIGILSLPSVFGLNHFLFEDHFECFEENVHFHETEIDCCTCDFIRLDIEYSSDNFNLYLYIYGIIKKALIKGPVY